MLIPGPDHPITIKPAKTRWRASYENHVIADTGDALILEEADLRPVVYFPREDVSMEYFSRTDRSTHCPYKGDAAYYTVLMDGQFAENAVWTYEDPFPSVEQIRGRLAFYPDKVEVYPVEDSVVNPRSPHTEVDEAILHTDAGGGHSQKEHWAPNVDQPAVPGEGGVR
jgi:uncharacterized protein (DUF427 family)